MFKAVLYVIALGMQQPSAVIVLDGLSWDDKAACVAAFDDEAFRANAMDIVGPVAFERLGEGVSAVVVGKCMPADEADKLGQVDDKGDE